MLPILTLHSLFSLTPLAQKKLLRIAKLLSKKETPSDLAPAGATWGSAPSPRSLFEKSDAKTFARGCPCGGVRG